MSKKSSTFAPAFEKSSIFARSMGAMHMVVIAQLAEHRIVVPSVVGSSPTLHPKERAVVALSSCV